MMPLWLKRDYRAVSFALVSAVLGVLFMRILLFVLPPAPEGYGWSLVSEALFSLPTQLVFFLGVPFAIYSRYGKRSFKQTLEYSSVGEFKSYYLLALPLGLAVFILTLGISTAWTELLRATGYTPASSAEPMPARFVFGFFAVEVLITAVLPAVCEEFCMRGGLLTTAQNTFKTVGCVVLCGVAFGLFHQNIRQVFYTSLFGALAAFITIRTRSLYPAMLMHFGNNFCSVYFNYASEYGWALGGGLYDALSTMSMWGLLLIFLSAGLTVAALTVLMLYLKEKRAIERKKEVLKDSAFDATNKRVVLMGEFDPERIKMLEMEKEVYGKDYERSRYKPTLRDLAIIISLAVVTVLTTVFTYVWGFFY